MTSESKRQRHKEGHRLRMEAVREAQVKAQRRRRVVGTVIAVAFAGIVIGAGVFLFGRGGDDDATDTTTTTSTTSTTSASTETTDRVVTTVPMPDPPTGTTIKGETPCPATDGSETRVAKFEKAPPMCIDEGDELEADVATSAGDFTVALDAQSAPTMVNNFVVLARYKYFDGLPFHRLIPSFMAQTGSNGDPTYAEGGPGYRMKDVEKPESGYKYEAGDVAMARGASGVAGSQFFVVATTEGADSLTPEYPLFGHVTKGQDIATVIASAGDPAQDGAPTKLITIESITIRSKAA